MAPRPVPCNKIERTIAAVRLQKYGPAVTT